MAKSLKQQAEEEAASELRKHRAEMERNKLDREYSDYRSKILRMTITERASRMHMFSLAYWAATGGDVPLEVQAQVRVAQEKYFTENPRRIYADPAVWKEFLPTVIERKGLMMAPMASAAMRVVESSIAQDMAHAR